MKDFLAVIIVRWVRWMERPKRRYDFGKQDSVLREEDYATRARLYYGDDQY